VKKLISKLGLGSQPYKIADGSGLSLYNYVSAELETKLLRYAWLHGNIYDHLYPALPIAGTDGTLEKRMIKTAADGNVRAKTGTLTGISSLAGYCVAANGHQLCFSIINQGVMRNQAGKDFQDRVCQVLCEPWGTIQEALEQ
jgi:D-alanyl-D-alanine carboxypeptidase/D-alanyl-D-alanine-endopeptidase (penicillin-binding protein 4)